MIQCDYCGAYQKEDEKCAFCGRPLPQYSIEASTNLQTKQDSGHIKKKKMSPGAFVALAGAFVCGGLLGWGLSMFNVLPDFNKSDEVQIVRVEQPKTNDEPQIVPQNNEQKKDESVKEETKKKDLTTVDIMKDVLARKIYKIKPEDFRNSKAIEQLKQKIVIALENNTRTPYSDHFIIQMDANLTTFQNALEKIQYEELYQLMLKSNEPKFYSTRGQTPFSWMPMQVTGSGKYTNPKTGAEEEIVSLGCTLSTPDDIDYFRPVLQMTTNNQSTGLEKRGRITWFPVDKSMSNIARSIDHQEIRMDVIPDKHFMMGLDDQYGSHDHPIELELSDEMIEDIRSAYMTAKYSGKKTFLPLDALGSFDTIVKRDIFYTVDGSFLEHNGSYYFILSYHSYSLRDMRERCSPMMERLNDYH